METKIYEKLKENEIRSMNHYFKIIGIYKEVTETLPTENIDILTILEHLELLPEDPDNLDKINDFYDYLFKFSIDLGIGMGKKMSIEAIQNRKIDFEKLKKIDPDSIVNYDIEPTFITDLREAIMNEK